MCSGDNEECVNNAAGSFFCVCQEGYIRGTDGQCASKCRITILMIIIVIMMMVMMILIS